MKILHVLDHSIPLHSGYTFRTAAILREQRRLDWETFHLTSPKQGYSAVPEETVDGLHFYRTQLRIRGVPFVGEIALINALTRRMATVAKTIQPDVIHAHSPVLNAIPALRVGRKLGIPVVYEVRAFWEDAAVDHGTIREDGLRYHAIRATETHVFRGADHITTICEGLKGDILARGIPEERVTVIPNAVDANQFYVRGQADDQLRAGLGLRGCRVLGFLGSFYAYEGLGLLLDALPIIREQAPDVRVLLVGGGPQDENLRHYAQQLGLGEQVVFAGRVPHDQVHRYYSLVDLLVYPRLSMRLTELVTPLKPLEAMAQGLLVVASDVGGHRELIRPGENGWLFPAGDASALARLVLQALSWKDQWPRIKAAGRRFVEEERNWTLSVSRYKPIYEQMSRGIGEMRYGG